MNEATTQLEIERKYLLRCLPTLPKGTRVRRLEQGYMPPTSETGVPIEGRLRRQVLADGSLKFTNTVKKGSGLVREETERDLTAAEFAKAWKHTAGRRLGKMRYLVREGDFVWAIDVFDALDLILAEVELPTEDTVAPIPAWLEPHVVREVTGETEFQNYELAARAHPELRG